MLQRSRNSGGEFAGRNQLRLWASSYSQYLLYKAQNPYGTCRQFNCSETFFVILCCQFGCRTSLSFTDQETQEENLQGGTSSLVGQFLHPISLVQSSRPIQRIRTVQIFRNKFLSCTGNLDLSMLQRSRNSGSLGEFTGWNQLPCGPVLTPIIPCTKLKIHSAYADSPIVPKHFLLSCAANLNAGSVYASEIKKLKKRICRVEPAPLWASSYTQYLLYKAQDPFSACRQSSCSETFFYLVPAIWM